MEKLLAAVLECDRGCLGTFDNVGYDLREIVGSLVEDRIKPTLSNIAGEIFTKGKNELWEAVGKALRSRGERQSAIKGVKGKETEYKQLQTEINELMKLKPDEDIAWSCEGNHISCWFRFSEYETIYRKYIPEEISRIESNMGFKFRGGDKVLKIYGFRKNWQGITEIEDSEQVMRDFVDGPLEKFRLAEDRFLVICNEESFIRNLDLRAIELGEGDGDAMDLRGIQHVIQGDFLVCRVDSNGKAVSILDEDAETIKHYLKAVDYVRDGVVVSE